MRLETLAKPQISSLDIQKAALSMTILGGAARMMAVLCDSTANAVEIAALVEHEPSICARVLRVANSPFYGNTRSVSTIERALVLLGLDAVRGIAAAACLNRTLTLEIDGLILDAQALLRHSLATAVAAECLAKHGHQSLAADVFIAGLLHNIGVLVQFRVHPSGVMGIIKARRIDGSRAIRSLESQYATVGHERCGALVLDAWRLPASLVSAAQHHHRPMEAPQVHRKLTALVNLGASVAVASGNTHALEPTFAEHNVSVMTCLGITVEDLNLVAANLRDRVDSLCPP